MATITGTVQRPDSRPFRGNIAFVPQTTPYVQIQLVVTETILCDVSDNGTFSQVLREGVYRVKPDGTAPFNIVVPAGSGTYDIGAILSGTVVMTGVYQIYLTLSDMRADTVSFTRADLKADINGDAGVFYRGGTGTDDGAREIINASGIHYSRVVTV